MSDVEVGSKRSGEYDEYGEISSYKGNSKRPRNDREKMRFLVLGRVCGAIIGKGGENIKRLRKENNININVQDTRQEGVLTLSGDRSTCVSVFKEILPLIPESPYPVNPKEKCAYEVNLLVQTDQVGSVIGKGGTRIREIREESSGKVRVYQDCLPNSNERIVAIGGEDESRVLAAFDIILKTLDDHPLKTQVHYYDPTKADGPGGMGGPPPQQHQHHDAPGNSQMGAGLGELNIFLCLRTVIIRHDSRD
jgi:heterogeneous nuclear ribonucleoprotein K